LEVKNRAGNRTPTIGEQQKRMIGGSAISLNMSEERLLKVSIIYETRRFHVLTEGG